MFPRPPFVPAWIPTELLVGSTVVIAVGILSAIWWQFVRPARRRRRAELAFWSPFLVAASLIVTAEQYVGTNDPARSQVIAAPLAVSESERLDEIWVAFEWAPGLVTGRPVARRVSVRLLESRALRWPDRAMYVRQYVRLPEEHVEIDLLGNRRLVTTDLLEELWAFHDASDTPETARAIWRTIRESSLARDYPVLAETFDYYVPR